MSEADRPHLRDDSLFRLADVAVEWIGDEAVALVVTDERFVTLDRAGGELLEAAIAALGEAALRPVDFAAFLAATYELEPAEAEAAAGRVARDWLGCGLLAPA